MNYAESSSGPLLASLFSLAMMNSIVGVSAAPPTFDKVVSPADATVTTPSNIQGVHIGQAMVIDAVNLEGRVSPVQLELRRVRVFADDAEIVVHSDRGDTVLGPPDNYYYVGSVNGDAQSRVFLTLRGSGELRGLIASDGLVWTMNASSFEGQWSFLSVAPVEGKSASGWFNCDSDRLALTDRFLERLLGPPRDDTFQKHPATKATASYTARVAVETDYEFYQIFGSVVDATDYVGDLIGYASGIYADEVDTTLVISHLSLWTSSSDPWNQNSTICGLFEFGKYWNYNRTGVTRTVAHFMSGKNLGGGIAWTQVLCSDQFDPSPWGYKPSAFGCTGLSPDSDYYGGAYGFTANINGTFDASNPGPVWDIISVSHEIGHNFSSPHTHCYKNIGGNSNPVDECYAGQECANSPSKCNCNTPHLPCSQAGAGCGTIMSYCHQLSGGYNNISLTFGEGHPYGVAPDRVPAQMYSHVLSAAGSNPACLAYIDDTAVFDDGFESHTTNAWSDTVP